MSTRTEAFQTRIARAWIREGKNIVIEYRSAEGKLDRLPALAADLVHLNVDLIVAAGGNFTASATKQATRHDSDRRATNMLDPVGSGFVANLARPGGNITGLTHAVCTGLAANGSS